MGQRRINRGHQRRQELCEGASLREESRNKMTPQQQLRSLDFRLGASKGAEKERRRLQRMIDAG